jgi:putative polyhydroxyalkanoate system protein
MATIAINRTHTLDRDEARRRAETLARSMEDRLGVRYRWEGDRIRFDAPAGAAKGATGLVTLSEAAVQIEVDLPLVLRGLKGTVKARIQQKLDKLLV